MLAEYFWFRRKQFLKQKRFSELVKASKEVDTLQKHIIRWAPRKPKIWGAYTQAAISSPSQHMQEVAS